MAYSDAVKLAVRREFVSGLSLKAAAAMNDVPYATARNWKRDAALEGDDWDKARMARRVGSAGIESVSAELIEEFILLFRTTLDALKESKNNDPMLKAQTLSRLTDSYHKMIASASKSNPRINRLSVAMDVLKRLSDFIREHRPDLHKSYLDIIDEFGRELGVMYGSK